MEESGLAAEELAEAVAAMTAVLEPALGRDWSAPAGDLEWTCRQTVAHVAHDLLAYAAQLSAGRTERYLPMDLVVREGAGDAEVLQVVGAAAGLLDLALRAAGPTARAWHFGTTDASGFATMGVLEVVVHTWDATRTLDPAWEVPPHLAAAVVARLFTDAPEADPVSALLWCTGRVALPGHPRLHEWTTPTPRPAVRADLDW